MSNFDLCPFQNARETKPVIADTQFPTTRNCFQTDYAVRRLIKVISDFGIFRRFSTFPRTRHRVSIYDFLVFNMALFFAEQNGWLSSHWSTTFHWLIFSAIAPANHFCHSWRTREPGTRRIWYYPLTQKIAVIIRKHFIENMADVGGMIAATGIESPNKRAKMDMELPATNFDESKFARYYRTDAVASLTSSHSSPVASDSSAFYSYPYTFTSNSFSSYTYPCGQTDATALYTYPASYGVQYSTLNGFTSEYSATTGMQQCA